jgi:thioesterase domain-containing protein
MAQQLRAQGEEVRLAVLVETAALEPGLRPLRRILRLAARGLNLSERRELECAYGLYRQFMVFEELSRSQKIRFLLRNFGRVRRVVQSSIRRLWHRSGDGSSEQAVENDLGGGWTAERVRLHYLYLIKGYLPRLYPGRIAVFHASDEKRRTHDPALGWRDLALAVDTYAIPGDHHACVSVVENIRVFAERLRSCLDEHCNVFPKPPIAKGEARLELPGTTQYRLPRPVTSMDPDLNTDP